MDILNVENAGMDVTAWHEVCGYGTCISHERFGLSSSHAKHWNVSSFACFAALRETKYDNQEEFLARCYNTISILMSALFADSSHISHGSVSSVRKLP